MNTIEFIKLANKKRLENKNEWIFLNEYVNERRPGKNNNN